MSNDTKEIINNIFDELVALQDSIEKKESVSSDKISDSIPQKVEMLTLKECTEVIDGLSYHAIRLLVKQGKVKSIRAGVSSNGKILVNKADLIAYLNTKDEE